MAKIKLPEELPPELPSELAGGGLGSKMSGVSRKLFGITKFLLGVCTLPFVYSVTVGYLAEFSTIKDPLRTYFWAGVISMVITYLFVWEPAIVYVRGQKLLEFVFTYLKPLVRVAPYLLPIYTIVIVVFYSVMAAFGNADTRLFMFLLGLTMALHLIFSAKTMRGKKEDFLKGNYIFGFSLIYIINLGLLAFCLGVAFNQFSFVNFCNRSYLVAKGIFDAVIKQLFL
jgi:hypothetical protein